MYNINIAKDPSQAIKIISDPILKNMNQYIEDCEADYKSKMGEKKYMRAELIDLKNQIFEEKVKQINF